MSENANITVGEGELELFKYGYLVKKQEFIKFSDNGIKPTKENFMVVVTDGKRAVCIGTVNDVEYCDPKKGDYDFKCFGMEVLRAGTPKELLDMLDEEIKSRQGNE